jgi:membrane-associated phospholipid phosphatase
VIAAAISAALFVAIYLLMIRTDFGHRFDNAALVGSHEQVFSTRLHDAFFLHRINLFNFTIVLVVIIAIGVARRRPWLGLTAAAGALLSAAGTDLLKYVVLSRPVLVRSDAIYPLNTFPSGHTATAIGCALALVLVSPPAWRGLSAVVAGSYAWITATDVQTAGWHRPSDAIGAALVAFTVFALLAALLARTRRVRTGVRLSHVPALVILAGVWVYAGVRTALNAARVLHYLATTAATVAPTPAVLNDAYQFSINLTIVVVVSLLAALLLLLDNFDLDARRDRPRATAGETAGAGHARAARDGSASSGSATTAQP